VLPKFQISERQQNKHNMKLKSSKRGRAIWAHSIYNGHKMVVQIVCGIQWIVMCIPYESVDLNWVIWLLCKSTMTKLHESLVMWIYTKRPTPNLFCVVREPTYLA
jgi:hypothetical protein